jgi:hypothetical protein
MFNKTVLHRNNGVTVGVVVNRLFAGGPPRDFRGRDV